MLELCPPERLTTWVPGEILFASAQLPSQDASLRSYRYAPLEVEVPALRDFTLVASTRGTTQMERRVDGPWQRARFGPGDVSVMTRAEASVWHWDAHIDVTHLYLTQALLSKVCADVFEREVDDIHLHDVLSTNDVSLNRSITSISQEATNDNLGGRLYVEAITTQICVHLLRHYANVSYHARDVTNGLSLAQARVVQAHIEANLDRPLSLEEFAVLTHSSESYFLRQFKLRFGMPPHAYVIQRRVVRAQEMLAKSLLPIKDIASQSGFSDQSHMTRVFQRLLGTTPSHYRQTVTGKA